MTLNPTALSHHHKIHQLICNAIAKDSGISHAFTYGSYPQNLADQFSDLEYYLYLTEAELKNFEIADWLRSLFPVHHLVQNELGVWNAITQNLLRMEFHILSASRIPELQNWPPEHVQAEAMLLKDSDGWLLQTLKQTQSKPATNPHAESEIILGRLVNWIVLGVNVLTRGERVRALESLPFVQNSLLRLLRLKENSTRHWHNPARFAEQELSHESLAKFASVSGEIYELEHVLQQAWELTKEFAVSMQYKMDAELISEIEIRLAEFWDA